MIAWQKPIAGYRKSECGRYIVSRYDSAGRVTYIATRLGKRRGGGQFETWEHSRVIGVERDLYASDKAACSDARARLLEICEGDIQRGE